MARIGLAAEAAPADGVERHARKHRHAVVALLAVERDVLVAQALQALEREAVVRALGFLQAEDVRPRRLDELGDEVDAQAYRVDVPGGDGETHQERQIRSTIIPWQQYEVSLARGQECGVDLDLPTSPRPDLFRPWIPRGVKPLARPLGGSGRCAGA